MQGLEAQQEKLVASEKQLSAKIEAFRSSKEVIKAQYSAAEAQVRIGEAATGIGEQMADTGLAIQRAKDKTEQMQARAAAVDELVEAGTLEDFTTGGQDQLDRELAQLSASTQVDDELAKMKAGLGTGEERKELQMIVRLMGEGQYRLSDDLLARLDTMDNRAAEALERDDEEELRFQLEQMGEAVQERGRAPGRRRPPPLRSAHPAQRLEPRGGAQAVRGRGADSRPPHPRGDSRDLRPSAG